MQRLIAVIKNRDLNTILFNAVGMKSTGFCRDCKGLEILRKGFYPDERNHQMNLILLHTIHPLYHAHMPAKTRHLLRTYPILWNMYSNILLKSSTMLEVESRPGSQLAVYERDIEQPCKVNKPMQRRKCTNPPKAVV